MFATLLRALPDMNDSFFSIRLIGKPCLCVLGPLQHLCCTCDARTTRPPRRPAWSVSRTAVRSF